MFISKQNLSRLVFLIILIICAWYVRAHWEELGVITRIRPAYLWLVVVSVLLHNVVNGYLNKELVRYFNVELSFTEWFGLAIVGAMGNYLTPLRGGVAGRAVYLKKCHDLPYKRFMTLFITSNLVIFFCGGFLGALTMVGIYLAHGFFRWELFVFFIGMSLSVVLFFTLFSRTQQGSKWERVSEAMAGWRVLSTNTALMLRVSLAALTSYLLVMAQIYYSFLALEFSITPTAAWFMAILCFLGFMMSVTPGNLGVQEALIGFLATLFGISFNQGVLAQGVIRAVNIVLIFTLGPFLSYILTRKLARKEI